MDFSNTELIYQINFSIKNGYCITTMNCDLVIANDYGRLLDDIKKLSTKSRLFLEKGAVYQFDLSLVEFALSFPIFSHIKRTLNVLVGNINFTISQILKIIEFFSLYMQFKNKGVGYEDAKKTKKNVLLSKTIKMLFNNELLLFNNIILRRL